MSGDRDPIDTVNKDDVAITSDLKAKVSLSISDWVREHLSNSPVSEHVTAWNHLQSKLPALTDALTELFGAPPK